MHLRTSLFHQRKLFSWSVQFQVLPPAYSAHRLLHQARQMTFHRSKRNWLKNRPPCRKRQMKKKRPLSRRQLQPCSPRLQKSARPKAAPPKRQRQHKPKTLQRSCPARANESAPRISTRLQNSVIARLMCDGLRVLERSDEALQPLERLASATKKHEKPDLGPATIPDHRVPLIFRLDDRHSDAMTGV